MTSQTLFFSLLLGFAGPVLSRAELVLVDKGHSLAPIVVFKDAPSATRRAADELAENIQKIAGVKPQVIEGEPVPVPPRAIWVGYQPVLRKLFSKTDFDFKQPEEILIAANENHLVIAGRDRRDPQHPKLLRKHGDLDFQFEYGTCNAVYTFLQDQLGVRWLWPGELGEDIPRRERIAFAPFETRYHPQMFFRRGVMWWLCRPANRGKLSADWARRQRVYLDSSGNLLELLNEGHGFHCWWERFHTTHPEYFALQPDGTRSGFPAPDRVKMCLSNPAVAGQWIADVAAQLEKEPTQMFFNASENDNHLAGYCVCPNCEAWDSPRAPKYKLYWASGNKEHVAVSDRQVRFANIAARMLRERYPGKDYKVVIYAYGPSSSAPLDVKPDADVIVAHVPNMWDDLRWEDQWSIAPATSARQIADWSATGAQLVWRPNLHSYAGLYQGLPDVPIERAVACVRHVVKDHRATGIGLAHFMNYWPTQGPLYYVLTQLTWNPNQDYQAILDDYYQRGFGPGSKAVKSYWSRMESTRNKLRDDQLPWTRFPQVYDAKFFQQAAALLDEADRLLASEPEIYRQRVAFVRGGLDFTRKIIALRELKNRYVQGGSKDTAMADQLRIGIAELERLANGSTQTCIGPVLPDQFLKSLRPETVEKAKPERKDLQ